MNVNEAIRGAFGIGAPPEESREITHTASSIDAGIHTELEPEPEKPSMNELVREAAFNKLYG